MNRHGIHYLLYLEALALSMLDERIETDTISGFDSDGNPTNYSVYNAKKAIKEAIASGPIIGEKLVRRVEPPKLLPKDDIKDRLRALERQVNRVLTNLSAKPSQLFDEDTNVSHEHRNSTSES